MQIAAQISQVWAVPPCYSGKNACLAPYGCIFLTKMGLLDFLFIFFSPGEGLLKVFSWKAWMACECFILLSGGIAKRDRK